MNQKARISLTLDTKIFQKIENARGGINRSKFINDLLAQDIIWLTLNAEQLNWLDEQRGTIDRPEYVRFIIARTMERDKV